MTARFLYTTIISPSQQARKLVEIGQQTTIEAPLCAFINGIIDKNKFTFDTDDMRQSFVLGPYTYSYIYQTISGRLCVTVSSTQECGDYARVIYQFMEEILLAHTMSEDRMKLECIMAKYNNQPMKSHDVLQQCQTNLDETRDRLRQNIYAALDRGDTLEECDAIAMELENQAEQFKEKALDVKKIVWWKRLKFRVCCCITCIIILIIILVILAVVLYVLLRAK